MNAVNRPEWNAWIRHYTLEPRFARFVDESGYELPEALTGNASVVGIPILFPWIAIVSQWVYSEF